MDNNENQFTNLNQEQAPVKRKHTLIWMVLLIVILLLIAGGYYFYQIFTTIGPGSLATRPADEVPADWQTYRNEEYGFELKYPTDWKFADNSGTDNDIQYLRINIESPSRVDLPGYEGVPVTYRILFWPGGDGPDHNITSYGDFGSDQLSKQSWWNLALDESIKRTTDEYKIGEQIISTFQSIDKDETADWQTYRNEEYGFELEFPLTWTNYQVNHDGDTICFKFDRPVPALSICSLNITVKTLVEWEDPKNDSVRAKYPDLAFAKNDRFYFLSDTNYFPECAQLDVFQCARSSEIKQILSTFKFLD